MKLASMAKHGDLLVAGTTSPKAEIGLEVSYHIFIHAHYDLMSIRSKDKAMLL